MAIEIERKWLEVEGKGIKNYKDVWWYDEKFKEVYYVCATPDLDIRVSRTWRAGADDCPVFKMVIKFGRGLAREELKYKITESQFLYLANLTQRPPIKKHMKKYRLGDKRIEYNEVDGEWGYYEVEYPTVEAAQADDLDLGKEVTGVYEFSMSNYWNNGLN